MNVSRGKSNEKFELFTNTRVFCVSVAKMNDDPDSLDYRGKSIKAFYRYIYHACDLYIYRFYFRQVVMIWED